jgi:hypothetical protein
VSKDLNPAVGMAPSSASYALKSCPAVLKIGQRNILTREIMWFSLKSGQLNHIQKDV